MFLSLALVFTFCIHGVSAASGDVIYVNGSSGNNSNNGLSWITAKKTIANGIKTVNNGGTVKIANGTYKEYGITLSKDVTIQGTNQDNTLIDAQHIDRIFIINPGVKVKISNLKLINGQKSNYGGAIYNYKGNLTLDKTTFAGNKITNGNGGTIYNSQGSITITNSIFANNSAVNAGAIFSIQNSSLNIAKCTFTNNTAINGGGAIYNFGTLTITNSTFTSNKATAANGGAINNQGTLTVTNSSFTNNTSPAHVGGAINNYGNCTVTSSTFTGNTSCEGAIYNQGNLNITSGTFNSNKAIGNKDCGGGAIFNRYGTTTINKSTFTDNNADSDGGGALKNTAGTLKVLDCIFKNNTAVNFGGTIYNYNGTLTVDKSIFINNTVANGNGGGIYNQGTLTVTNSVFTSNSALNAGAIFSHGYFGNFKITISNCTFTNNMAGKDGGGGAIYDFDTLNVSNSTFTNNTAIYGGGGAIYVVQCNLTVTNSTFTGNTATKWGGGAIKNSSGSLKVTNSTFINNTSTTLGGAIYGTGIVNFNRIVGNGINEISNPSGSMNANYNWWGSNTDPSGKVSGNVTVGPWLVLNVTSNPITILTGKTSTITADLQHDSNGVYHNPANGHVPDGILVNFASTSGTINSQSLKNGTAQFTLKGGSVSSIINISATVDSQTFNTSVTVTPLIVTAVDPTYGSINVPVNKIIEVTFSEPVKAGSMWIELRNNNGTAIQFTTNINGNVLTITPSDPLANGIKYTLILHTGSLIDLTGISLALWASNFTTQTV